MSDPSDARAAAAALMPDVLDRLGDLVRIPSIAFPGFDPEPVHRMGQAVVDLFEAAGAEGVRLVDVPDGYPCVFADLPGPDGAPTVLLYAHYDVQPAPASQNWSTPPFEPVTKSDGRIYGRGAADDKSGLVIHYATLKLLGADRPCRVKILVEGEEETISHLEPFVEANPELFTADAFVIADIGPQSPGRPGLTTALRGDVACTVTVRTLANPVHSGEFGGAAPDALTAMIRILDTLHDENGDTVIPGVDSGRWDGAAMDEDVYRGGSAILPGVDYLGTGSLSDRIWAKPSVTVLGMDVPSTAEASNVLLNEVKAKLSMRIIPGSDGDGQLEALMAHLRAQRPWNCEVVVEKVKVGHPFAVDESHPAIVAAEDALREAYGAEVESIGSGASIPLVASLKKIAPDAAIVLWGAEDTAHARIHASDESVDPAEIERMIVAQTRFIQEFAGG
ncbi:acetylornithine deacetylase/succinyl-diaminopimelate desuccinylase-like protein [Microbacterium terrae]|uniref:Succinyl-diaminopimelate desuccinylase n=1 Tax=Microbacterium terrae TaxID=69369 RepID=A0A0M2GWS1_9MICO|nr:M20/M25/M40 family metallo-hydrolase [Microbacterium terrae]KJL38020.1 putative succinyl-diaminopimelate desuccinylase [Microbacterium terrae]MBP1077432.1 acetylornithine deacetylase/succinyl-diaminopimelate desuccinylase-like protein [Microbacterium terrae]GLJ99039.1 dipeptidase [Microbacterium terrae]